MECSNLIELSDAEKGGEFGFSFVLDENKNEIPPLSSNSLYAWCFTMPDDGKIRAVDNMFIVMKKNVRNLIEKFDNTLKKGKTKIMSIRGYPELTKRGILHMHCEVMINSSYHEAINQIASKIWCLITKSKMCALKGAFDICRNPEGYAEYIRKDPLHKLIGIFKYNRLNALID